MKIGFLIPRYGPEAFGGAELAARSLAEQLVREVDVECEVFTTCARDAATWRDELPPGTTEEGGVTVHRFRSQHGRRADFGVRNAALLADPEALSVDDAWEWVAALGPVCPDAVGAAVESLCDVVTVHPYLYHPCITGVHALGPRAVLHPAAHDEPSIHLPLYEPMFLAAGALAFWSDEERAATQRLFPATVARRQIVVGFGVEPLVTAPPAPSAPAGRPYLLCFGKVLSVKGCAALATAFRAYKRRRPSDLALVFAGPLVDPLPGDDDVIVLGAVDDDTKTALFAHCVALVSPSPYESLSLVVLEAWAAGRPVLVNGACDATRGHCERHGGGLWFVDYGTFEGAVDRLVAGDGLADTLGEAGRAAVREHFEWSAVVARYLAFVTALPATSGR